MKEYFHTLRLFSRDIRLFLLAVAIHGFVFFGIYALLLNLYLLRLGYGPRYIGAVNAAGPLALAIASLPAGAFSRKVGSRRALMIALGGGFVIAGYGYTALFIIGAALALSSALIFRFYFRQPRGELAQTRSRVVDESVS